MNRISTFYTDNGVAPCQLRFFSYEKLLNYINSLLEKNQINVNSIELYKASNFISVELPEDAKEEEIKNVKELFLSNGAKHDGRRNLFMGNVEILINKNQNPIPFF